MDYRIIDKETYYRKGVFRHFSEDCRCSTSMTGRVDVTALKEISAKTGTKFYVNFLYILSKVLNSREDFRMGYLYQTQEIICYDVINPTQYVFHEDTETCTPVYSDYTRTTRCSIKTAFPISKGRNRRGNICWTARIIPTGSMPVSSRGFPMTA